MFLPRNNFNSHDIFKKKNEVSKFVLRYLKTFIIFIFNWIEFKKIKTQY
jgi:hypothetical protein